MDQPRSSHHWISRYCVRTLQLLPTLPTPVAIRWAVEGYPYCSDTEPELAAERFINAKRSAERAQQAADVLRFVADRTPGAVGSVRRRAEDRRIQRPSAPPLARASITVQSRP